MKEEQAEIWDAISIEEKMGDHQRVINELNKNIFTYKMSENLKALKL